MLIVLPEVQLQNLFSGRMGNSGFNLKKDQMTNFIKPAIIILTLSLCVNPLFSQIQTSIKDHITNQFIKYTGSVQREEIYVHTDRDYYIAGEDMWFNVYLVYRQGNMPASEDKLAYVELLNQYNRPVVRKTILLDNGFGPGQLILPDSLSSGTYTLRSYSRRMKNFLPENCFMKEIKIYNVLSKKPFVEKVYPEEKSVKKERNSDLILQVNNSKPDSVEIMLTANNSYLSENNNSYYLFIQTNGLINHMSSEKADNGSSKLSVSKGILPPGINHITIFDMRGTPVCERFIYTQAKENSSLNVNCSPALKAREKFTLTVDPGVKFAGQPTLSNISISVTPFTARISFPDLSDYLIFGSEFGQKPFKSMRGRKLDSIPLSEIDSILLEVKSNWIDWNNILSGEPDPIKYKPETVQHYLSGKLLKSNSHAPDSGAYIFMSTPGKVPVFQYARTDSEGSFTFSINIDDIVKDLVIQPAVADNNNRIRIESPFSDIYLTSEIFIDTVNNAIPGYVSKAGINYQVNKIYGSSFSGPSIVKPVPQEIPQRFYGKPDLEIKLKDYIKLPVMEEVFFELVKGAYLKKTNEKYELFVMDPVDDKLYGYQPGIMVDGVIVNSPDIIAGLDPDIVERIDLIRDKYYIGEYLFHGIVNVVTIAGDFSSVTLPDYAIRLQYKAVEPVSSFISPDYSRNDIKAGRIPDFRNTLYWNPSMKPDKDGKVVADFWSSDIVSDFEISVQGITSEGELISIRRIISTRHTF